MSKVLYKKIPQYEDDICYKVKSKEEIKSIISDINLSKLISEFLTSDSFSFDEEFHLHTYVDLLDGSVNIKKILDSEIYDIPMDPEDVELKHTLVCDYFEVQDDSFIPMYKPEDVIDELVREFLKKVSDSNAKLDSLYQDVFYKDDNDNLIYLYKN